MLEGMGCIWWDHEVSCSHFTFPKSLGTSWQGKGLRCFLDVWFHVFSFLQFHIREREERVSTGVLLNTHCPSPPWLLAVSLVVAQMVLFHFPNDLPQPSAAIHATVPQNIAQSKTPISICCVGLHLHLQYVQQTCRMSSSAVALLRAEQGPCEPSKDFVSKFGEQ